MNKENKDFNAGVECGRREGYTLATEKQIIFLLKVKERLKGYACGYHKELDKMLDNEIKRLKR